MARIDNLSNFLTDVATAIKEKKGDNTPILASEFDTEITNLPSGGGIVSKELKDINFFDYDGTCLYSYTMEEFANVTELPPLPEKDGFTYTQWNWTLSDIKGENSPVDVGTQCITSDGWSRVYFELGDLRCDPYFALGVNGTVEVDWGDGSPTQTMTNTNANHTKLYHKYATGGKYVIKFKPISGYVTISGNDSGTAGSRLLSKVSSTTNDTSNMVYAESIYKIELGENVQITSCGCKNLHNLESINLPDSSTIGNPTWGFYGCSNLKFVSFPSGMTNLKQNIFQSAGIRRMSLPKSCTFMLGYGVYQTPDLSVLRIPSQFTGFGSRAFQYCQLLRLVIPEKVTSISTYVFYDMYRCESLKFLGNVTKIEAYNFSNCYALLEIDLSNCTSVPTIATSNVFTSVDSACKVIVPDDLYDTWIADANWSAHAGRIIKHSDYYI